MSRTLGALSNDTIDAIFDNWVSRSAATGERSSSPFKDYADRDLGSPNYYFVH